MWSFDRPFTDCPAIGDPMDGGELRLSSVNADPAHYTFACVWQLKLPEAEDNKLSLFVRLTNIDIDEYGRYSRALKLSVQTIER